MEEKESQTNTFVGFVLLDETSFEAKVVLDELKNRWNIAEEIVDESIEKEDSPIVLEHDGMMLAIMYIDAPVPNNEAVLNAQSNYFWPEAVDVTQKHKAHLIVSVFGREYTFYDTSIMFTKLCDSCLALQNATGVYAFGTVYEPKMYRDVAKMIDDGETPTPILTYIGVYNTAEGVCAYTFGLSYYNKKELEVVNSKQSLEDVYDMLYGIVGYVIAYDVTLQDGETIGFSEEQKLPISLSPAFVDCLTEDSLKILF